MELNRKEDLKRMYALFGRVNALEKLKIQFNTYIKSAGATLISALAADPEKEKTLVQELLDFKLRLDGILEDSFSKNDNFAYALKVSASLPLS
jgi:cullin-4